MNFAFLSLLAASRTRSSALSALVRHWVRDAFCWLVFPLARPLPSAASAAARPALFGSFVGTLGLSEFPPSCIIGVWPPAFPMRPGVVPPTPGDEGTSRFSRRKIPRMRGVSDRAETPRTSR